jgi:predicted peroxiredoxin
MFGLFKKKNCDQLCVGKQEDMLDSAKLNVLHDFANTAYQNGIEIYGETEQAFKYGKEQADLMSKVKSVDTSEVRKDLEKQYKKMLA